MSPGASRPIRPLAGATAVLVLAVLLAPVADGADRVLTLSAALAAARADSPLLHASARRGEAAERAAEAVRAARYGRLDGILSYTRHQDDVIVRPMSQDLVLQGFENFPFDRDQVVAGIAAAIPVYTSGRLSAAADAAAAEARRATLTADATEDDILGSVRMLYVRGQTYAAQLTAVQARTRALESRREDLVVAVEIGRAAPVELRRVEASLAGTRSDAARLTALYEATVADLLALVGSDPDEADHVVLEPPPERLPELREDAETLRDLAADGPGVRSAAAGQDAAAARARQARAERLPSVSLTGNWLTHWAPSVDGTLDTWQLGLEVAIPLFDGGARKARQTEAELRAAEAAARLESARARTRAELRAAVARWQAAAARIDAARARMDAMLAVERVERTRWETGAGILQDLLDAEADRLGAESELIAARGDVRIAAAELNRISSSEVVW